MHPRLADLVLCRTALDRAGSRRAETGLLDRVWADDRTRVLRVAGGRAPATTADGAPALQLVGPRDVGGTPRGTWVFLGEDADGVAHLAVDAGEPQDGWVGLRDVGALLDDLGAGQLTTAVAVLAWHATHPRCPRCGAATELTQGGWVRRCPEDGSEHYPRTDPAVIMAVVGPDDRLLLGHNPRWPQGRFSTLAGFVEPGESLEAAVRREVLEEVGVPVGDVEYVGSQPWPFPASLMLGFFATALSEEVRVDATEITEARWFTRDELRSEVSAGTVLPPSGISIARRLVEHWYGGPLADGPATWR